MILKNSEQTKIREFSHLNKNTYKEAASSIIRKGEMLNAFPLILGMTRGSRFSSLLSTVWRPSPAQ